MKQIATSAVPAWWWLAMLIGCEGDLPKATEIERMRILGAEIAVLNDEERATPKPGESVRISLTTVFPSVEATTEDAQMMLLGCTAPNRYTGGIPICQELIDFATGASQEDIEDVLATSEGMQKTRCSDLSAPRLSARAVSVQCVDGEPLASLAVPKDFKAEEMLFLGVVCERGDAFVDPSDPLLFGCDDNDGETIRVHGVVRVQHEKTDQNHNPEVVDALEFQLDTNPWKAFETLPPDEGCESRAEGDWVPELPEVDPGDHTITLRYAEAAREETNGSTEAVEISVHATLGEMERRFTLFAKDEPVEDGKLISELDWIPPDPQELPRGGQLVRFFITVRDQRGGYGVASRALCLRR